MSEDPSKPAVQPPASKPTKERSPGYPSISLRRALELTQKFWDSDRRQAVMPVRAAQNLGFSAKSSAGMMALAAMKKYGLLDEEGANETRRLKLSDAAIGILNPSNANRSELIKKAALKPGIIAALWGKYGAEGASAGNIQDYLIFERKFVEEAAKLLITVYTDTVKFAELTTSDKVEGKDFDDSDDQKDDSNGELPLFQPDSAKSHQKDKGSFQQPDPPAKEPSATPPTTAPTLKPGLKYLAIPTDIGDAHIPLGMSEEDFELFGEALKLFKKKIVRPEFPKRALWQNKDHDKEVVIVGFMGAEGGRGYFRSEDGSGIPADELTFLPN